MTVTSSIDPARDWLLLLYFLPTSQAQARVQAWRRLQRVGAVLLNNSAYVLPSTPDAREDFEWIRQELEAHGGQAVVLEARALSQATTDRIVNAFQAARSREFEAMTHDGYRLRTRTSRGAAGAGGRRQLTQRVRRLRERYEDAVRLDFFGAPGRERVAALLAQLDQATGRIKTMESTPATPTTATKYRGKVWLTRPRPGVDRMSSAWLIRRFIDPKAKFVFGESNAAAAVVRFDTFDADFGHQDSHCTYETLCERFGLRDPSVRHIGRIVHDLDLKEHTYGEAETATIGGLVEGLRRTHRKDEELLRAGIEMFEALYQSVAAVDSRSTVRRHAKRPNTRARASAARR